jgi:hypothetical protein
MSRNCVLEPIGSARNAVRSDVREQLRACARMRGDNESAPLRVAVGSVERRRPPLPATAQRDRVRFR